MDLHEKEPLPNALGEWLNRISEGLFEIHSKFVVAGVGGPGFTKNHLLLRSPDKDLYCVTRLIMPNYHPATTVHIMYPDAVTYDEEYVYEYIRPELSDFRTMRITVNTRVEVPVNEFLQSDLTREYVEGLEADLEASEPVRFGGYSPAS